MIRTMTTAVNTMNGLQQQIDVIGNNLANSATNGYKANQSSFQEMLYQQFDNDKADSAERMSPGGIRYGNGAKIGTTLMNWKQGSLQVTGRELDFALTEPKQYFNVLMPGENGEMTAYTRQGNFYVSPAEGGRLMLVNGDGYPVADSAGNGIVFREGVKNYSVRPGGVLEASYEDGTVMAVQLGVTTLERPNLMNRLSDTVFALPGNLADLGVTAGDVLTEMNGANRQQIGLSSQQLEASNVNYEKEMTDLINVQRSYQFNARTITLADQMLGLVNSIR